MSLADNESRRPLVLLTDSLSTRVFFSSGIVEKLWREYNGKIDFMALFDIDSIYDYRQWLPADVHVLVERSGDVIDSGAIGVWSRFVQGFDRCLDSRIGFYPLAVRFSILHNYHLCRMSPGHKNSFLNSSLAFPFPHSRGLFERLKRWCFGSGRFVNPGLLEFLKRRCSALVPTNMQVHATQEYLLGADRLGIPIVGHIGSWDHPVGKGAVFPRCQSYIVQNAYMQEKLVSQHDIPEERITVTGWPQMDLFAHPRNEGEYRDLLRSYDLRPDKPCLLIAGNSEGNAPYEPNFVERFVQHWEDSGAFEEYSIIFRPHPRDIINEKWKTRFSSLLNRRHLYVQSANYADIDVVSLLLQHVGAVMTNAGTILLDSLVNDRPVVCVLYDEGGPAGSVAARNNVAGDHYAELMSSDAFVIGTDFEAAVSGVHQSMQDPESRRSARRRICDRIAGKVDGHAGHRVAEAIVEGFNRNPSVFS